MDATQTVYLARLADLETALEAVQKASPTWTGDETDAEFEAKDQIEQDLYELYHITEKRNALFAARRVLWTWAKNTISEQMHGHPQLETALAAFGLVRGNVEASDRLTEMCLKLTV